MKHLRDFPLVALSFIQMPLGLCLGAVAVVFLAACGDSSSPTEPTGLTPVVITSVEVTPATATLAAVGATQQFSATAKDASGNGISGKTFTWVSTNDGVATVSASGLATAVSNGSATIRATTDGVTGTASLTVAQQVVSVDVTTGRDTLTALGDTTRLTAEGKDARGNVVAATFTWTSSDTSVATVDTAGVVTAVGNGTATISAGSNQRPPVATNASGNTVSGRSLPRTSPGVKIATIGHSELDAAADHGPASVGVTAAVTGSATITVAQTADPPTSTITAAPTAIPSDGASTSTITVQTKDGAGTNLTTGGATVALSTTLGTLGAVTDNADGTYTATLTAGTAAGTATVTGTLNGTAMTDDAVVTFGPSPATTTITASLTSIPADGASTSTITVQAKDGAGTNLTTGGATVALSTTLGTLGAVTDNADGTYTATLTAGFSAGTATITGTLNGTAITQALAIDVFDPLVLSTSYLVGGYPSTSYSDAIVPATGGDGTYTYSVTDGSLPAGLSLNSSTGAITGTTTGSGMSFFEITATSVGLSASALYSITISTNAASGFNMGAINVATAIPPTNVRQQIDAALARWEQVVISNLGSLVLSVGADAACGLATSLIGGQLVAEVLMLIDVAPIDGVGGILGGANTCWFAGSAPFTIVGTLTLDISDIVTMADADLFALIWHELAHAMGFGKTHWDFFSYLVGAGTADPRYFGAGAVAEYSTLLGGAAVSVPVEDQGGVGTQDTHWREIFFDTEIMTGFLDFGVANPISRMTIMSLLDVGWSVNLGAADAYSLPACFGACLRAPARQATDAWEVLLDLPGGIQPRGGAPRSGPKTINR